MEVKFVGVPMHLGSDCYGLNYSIKKLLRSYPELKPDMRVIDFVYETKEDEFDEKLKYVSPISKVCEDLAREVHHIVQSGQVAVTIGGDHSISIGSIAGVAKEKRVGVLWVDAHGDMNTPQTTPSGNIHGMPLAVSQGYGDTRLTQCYFDKPKVNEKNVVILGARDLDEGEVKFIKTTQCKLVSFEQLRRDCLVEKLEEVYGYLMDGTDGVHLSFDLDALNPVVCPGVSVPVAGGFNLDEIDTIFDFFLRKGTLLSIDLVEYNPVYDHEDKTLGILIHLINKIKQYGYKQEQQAASAE